MSNIITKRDIARYLVSKGYANTNLEVYTNYIGRGMDAYIPIYKISMEEGLKLITNCGGIPVLAHPSTLDVNTDFDKLIPYMKENGLLGIETKTARHTKEQREFFGALAKKYNLIETAGSDFHRFSDGIMPGVIVSDDFLENFYSLLKR
jgi:predicted metal-dependent phosphoesterase TrpH